MTPKNLREVLTAAVDGELSPADRKAAERLLRESESARKLYAQLKADAGRVRSLPRAAAPADLADSIMAVIHDRSLTPTPLPPSPRPATRFNWSALPVWVSVGTAAAVLIVVGVGSYLYFAASERYIADQRARATSVDVALTQPPAGEDSPPVLAAERLTVPPREATRTPEAVVVLPPEVGPDPRLVEVGDVITSPPRDSMPEIESFQIDKIRVSHLFNLKELTADPAAQQKLAAEMKKDELIRLDLFCRATPRALDLVAAGLKARGVVVLTDAFAHEQLKKKNPPELMIFTESLTADEVAQFMAALGTADKKGGAGEFDTLVAAPFLSADLTQLGKLLGIPGVAPQAAKGKSEIDIRKPLPEGTANQVAATLAKMGSGSPVRPKHEKVGVVVAYSPMNTNPAASREIKQFLDRRGERRPDAKPLMLVLKTIK